MNVLIIDDEAPSRAFLRDLLNEHPDVVVAGESAGGSDALQKIQELAPDVIFLDVRMTEGTGFDLLQEIPANDRPLIIFVSAYDEYAINAFDEVALDYVLKPIDPERLSRACQRARHALVAQPPEPQRLPAHTQRGASGYADRIFVKGGNRVVVLNTSEIHWIGAAGNYSRIYAQAGMFIVRESMTALEQSLDPAKFVRIHRSTIVNLDHVKEMQPWFSGEWIVIMRDETKLKLSRIYRAQLEKRVWWLS